MMSPRMPKGFVDRRLRLSPQVTFHARGEACFAWHGDTGDVCEMSRDVVALMMVFAGPRGATAREACARVPSIGAEQAAGFVDLLGVRAFLHPAGQGSAAAQVDLGARRPFVPRSRLAKTEGDGFPPRVAEHG